MTNSNLKRDQRSREFVCHFQSIALLTCMKKRDILDSLPAVIPGLSTDKQSLLRHLEKTNPESLALAKDWEDVAHQLHRTRLKIEK